MSSVPPSSSSSLTASTNSCCSACRKFVALSSDYLSINQSIRYPTAFEFTAELLVALADHVHASLFGTFLANNVAERFDMKLPSETASFWYAFRFRVFRSILCRARNSYVPQDIRTARR